MNDDSFFLLFFLLTFMTRPFTQCKAATLMRTGFRPKPGRSNSIVLLHAVRFSDSPRLVLQDRQRKSIVVPGLCITDFGLRLLKLCLTQLHDRSQAQVVPRLREA